MPSANITALTDYAGGQSPADLMYIGASPFGATDDRKSTLDDLFETITKNITEKSVIFQDADGVRTVSAVNTGKLSYSVTNQSFQVSENGGAYQNLVKGVGANTRVAFWTDTDTLSSDSAFLWDETNDRLLINVAVASGEAPIDVKADVTATAQQWRENAGAAKVLMQVPSSYGQLGTVGAHDFALVTNSLQRVNVESGGAAVFGSIVPATGQVMVNALTTNTIALIANNAAATSVDIARFQVNSSNRFVFTNAGEMVVGLASTIDGKITLASAGAAFTQSLMAGTAPAATNAFRWPNADPTSGQALTASAPAAGVVTLSWSTIVTSPASPVNSVQFNNAGAFGGSSSFLWDNSNNRLLLGVTVASGAAPLDILADGSAVAQQWRQNAGAARVQVRVPSSYGEIGTTTTHDFAILTNNLQRVNVESGGAAVFGSIVPATGQVMVNALTTNTIALIANNAAATSVDIARFQINSSNRFVFTKDAEMVAGLAATIDGKITLASAGAAFTQSLMAGTAPAATNAFRWPNADPTSGQALTASAPAAGIVTLSWTTISATPASPVNSVQFNNAGAFGGSSGFLYVPSSTTGNELSLATSTLTSGNALSITASGTAAASNTKTALNVTTSGANAAASQTTYGARFFNISTGTSSTNIGAFYDASGGTTNYQLVISGFGNGSSGAWFQSIGGFTRFQLDRTGSTVSLEGTQFQYGVSLHHMWSSSANALGGSFDVGLNRFAAGVLRITNSSTGLGSLLIASSTDSLTGNFTVMSSNAATNSLVTVARLGVNSTGTAADGFGASLSFSAESSTTNDSETARINAFWTTATHASRTAAISWSLTNNTTLAEYMRLGVAALSSPVVLSVHGGTTPNVWTSGSFAPKLYLIGASLPAVGVAAHFSATALDAPQWQMLRGRGTNTSPTAVQASDSIGNIEWWGQTSTSTNNVVAGARIRVSATENWSAGNNGCQMIFFVSNNAGTITEVASIQPTGCLRIGATAGSTSTDTKLQIGGYASWNTDVVAAIYTGANDNKGLEIIGTSAQTDDLLRAFRDSVTPDLFRITAAIGVKVRGGLAAGSSDYAAVGGSLKTNTTAVGNVGTGEDNLITYSLPGSTLGTNGDFVEIDAWGDLAANANNKTVKLYFGATVLFDSTAFGFNGGAWRITATVVRTGATTQIAIATYFGDATLVSSLATYTTPAETLSGAVTIKCTGTATADNDIVQRGLTVKWFPNSQ